MPLSLRPRVEKRERSPSIESSDDSDDDRSPQPVRRPAKKRGRGRPRTREDFLPDAQDEEGDEPRALVLGRAWLPREDQCLLAAVEKYGSCWKQVAAAMQHLGTRRTTAMCRNRHQRIRAPTQPGKEGRNRCKRCGQIKRGHTCTAVDVAGRVPDEALASLRTQAMPAPRGRGRPPLQRPPTTAAMPAGHAAVGAGDGVMRLPDHPLLPPTVGNAFNVDTNDFLAEVRRSMQPHGERVADYVEQYEAAQAAAAAQVAQGPLGNFSLASLGSFGPLLAGVHNSAAFTTPTAGADSRPPPENTLPPSAFLNTAGPPPVAGGPRMLGQLPTLGSQRSLGNLSFSASVISDVGDLVDLADLTSADHAALASRSFGTIGTSAEPRAAPKLEEAAAAAAAAPRRDAADDADAAAEDATEDRELLGLPAHPAPADHNAAAHPGSREETPTLADDAFDAQQAAHELSTTPAPVPPAVAGGEAGEEGALSAAAAYATVTSPGANKPSPAGQTTPPPRAPLRLSALPVCAPQHSFDAALVRAMGGAGIVTAGGLLSSAGASRCGSPTLAPIALDSLLGDKPPPMSAAPSRGGSFTAGLSSSGAGSEFGDNGTNCGLATPSAPPLMPLPSWSRAPSFDFWNNEIKAERPVPLPAGMLATTRNGSLEAA